MRPVRTARRASSGCTSVWDEHPVPQCRASHRAGRRATERAAGDEHRATSSRRSRRARISAWPHPGPSRAGCCFSPSVFRIEHQESLSALSDRGGHSMTKKVSRRDFARTSVAAGAAADVAFPDDYWKRRQRRPFRRRRPQRQRRGGGTDGFEPASATGVSGMGATRSQRSRQHLAAHSGVRDSVLRRLINGWRESTTFPAEYYVDEKHYLNDERFIADNSG